MLIEPTDDLEHLRNVMAGAAFHFVQLISARPKGAAHSLRSGLFSFEQTCGRIYLRAERVYCGSSRFYLRLDLCPLLLLNGFAHARNSFHTVARVKAGRVYLVLEPGTARKPLLICE